MRDNMIELTQGELKKVNGGLEVGLIAAVVGSLTVYAYLIYSLEQSKLNLNDGVCSMTGSTDVDCLNFNS